MELFDSKSLDTLNTEPLPKNKIKGDAAWMTASPF